MLLPGDHPRGGDRPGFDRVGLIASRVTQYEIKWGVMAAAGVLAMLPVLVFAGLTQRYLVRGLSLGAVKG